LGTQKKATHLLTNVLHSILAKALYKDSAEALEDHYRYHQLVMAYCSQLKARSWLSGESLHKFAAINEQPTNQALSGLPQH
jgi:hypothetical protein